MTEKVKPKYDGDCANCPVADECDTVYREAAEVKPKLHCWADSGGGATCMLPLGHDGKHEFASDSEIIVRFKEADE